MREILFRGKRNNDDKWVYGFLVSAKHIGDWVLAEPVFPKTVGQFTGLTDKNGKKIFEGDIVRSVSSGEEHIGIVNWNRLFSSWHIGEFATLYGSENFLDNEVIGNIHDNPELLEAD